MKILTLDIETAPILANVWGIWQQNVGINQIRETGRTIMVGAKWLGSKEVFLFDEHEHGTDMMLEFTHELMSEADVIVGHNVDRFDMNILHTEFIKKGLTPPDPSRIVDTLKVVKRSFRFESNKLDFVAQQLGLGGKLSHPGFDMWIGWMNNEGKYVRNMRKYCMQDVRLTEKLYLKLRPWIKSHPNHGLEDGVTSPTCTNCGSPNVHKKGKAYTKVGIYQRYKCKACGTPMRGRYTLVDKERRRNILTQEQ